MTPLKKSSVLAQIGRFRTVTDTGGKKSSIFTQIGRFQTVTPVLIHEWLWNDTQSLKQHRRGALLFSRSSVEFQGHTGQKVADHQFLPESGFYTKGRPLVKSNLICPSVKLCWQPGCPILNINIRGNFFISQGNGSSDNLPENLV